MPTDAEELLKTAGASCSLDLHRAGHCPSSRDTVILNTQLRSLNDAYDRLTAEMGRLAELRSRVREQAAIHTSMLSPCHRLPPEVWSMIFLLALPNDWTTKPAGARPLNLAEVCHHWRAIILQTPQIWTRFFIQACRGPNGQKYNVEGIKRELARTGGAPLTIAVYLIDDEENQLYRQRYREPFREALWTTDIWATLCAHCERWERVWLTDASVPAMASSMHPGMTFPALRHLTWDTHNMTDPDIVSDLRMQLFANAPNLESLQIEYWAPPAIPPVLPRSWALTSLYIRAESDPHAPLAPLVPLIMACSSSLVLCDVSAPIFGASVESQPRGVFPVLRVLHLQLAAIHLCRLMTAPAVETIHLAERSLEVEPVNEITAFEALLDNSNDCQALRDLDLAGFNCTARSVVECLQRLPHLKSLSITNSEYFDLMNPPASLDLIRALTRDSTRPDSLQFLPRLVSLYLAYSHGNANPDEEDEAVWEMFESRSRPPHSDGQSLSQTVIASARGPRRRSLLANSVKMDPIDRAIEEACNVANVALHRTPFVPDDACVRVIKQKAQELRQLEGEADLMMMSIYAKLNALRRQIAIHNALTSPCRRVPPEILSEIFLFAVPQQWKSQYVGQRTLNFARVCHSWRRIALATPRLWTTLRFATNVNPPALHVAALRDDLLKTAQAPLELELEMDRYNTYPPLVEEPWSYEAWALLCAQSHRWKRVSFAGIPKSAYEDLAECAFPALDELSILLDDNGDDDDEGDPTIRVPIHAFHNAPKVSDLSIEYRAPILPFDLPSSWSLMELSIHCNEDECTLAPSLGAIFSCSGTVRKLRLSAEAPCAIGLPPTSFPHLEELHMGDGAIALLHSFTAPGLRTLWMGGYSQDGPFEALQSMLARSENCRSLRSLTLEGLIPGLQVLDLIPCLRRLSSLEELEVQNNEDVEEVVSLITPDLLRALIRDPGAPESMAFLPNLARLAIGFGAKVGDAKNPDFGSLLKSLLASRRQEASVDGKELALLQALETDGGGRDCRWPPRDEDDDSMDTDSDL
ncbi:hypothetical protein EV715DRAFT_293684 [Schizophyllum commune]